MEKEWYNQLESSLFSSLKNFNDTLTSLPKSSNLLLNGIINQSKPTIPNSSLLNLFVNKGNNNKELNNAKSLPDTYMK